MTKLTKSITDCFSLAVTTKTERLTLSSVEVTRNLTSRFEGQFSIQLNYLDDTGSGTYYDIARFPFRTPVIPYTMGDVTESMAEEMAMAYATFVTATFQTKINTINKRRGAEYIQQVELKMIPKLIS